MRRKGQIGNSISAIVISFALALSIMPANQVKAAQQCKQAGNISVVNGII